MQQLQEHLKEKEEHHQCEVRAIRQSMAEQIRAVQLQAKAELEAAQTRLQLVRLKQKRVVAAVLGPDTFQASVKVGTLGSQTLGSP